MSRVECDARDGVPVLTFRSRTLSIGVLVELESALAALSGSRTPLVVTSVDGSIFLAGAHLGDIARLDGASSREYAFRGRRALQRLAEFPGPTVAAVEGACAGGALDLVTACDAVVAGPSARFGHPGVRRGLVTGWGGTAELPWRMSPSTLAGLVTSGELLDSREACRLCVVQEISDDPLVGAVAEARRLEGLGPRRLERWRELRSGRFIDRFVATVVHNMVEANTMTDRERT